MSTEMQQLKFKHALLPEGWAEGVRISIDKQGTIAAIETDMSGSMKGCALPGLANLHSHAHQRAMAGLAERSGSADDSFWTWRTTMYQFLAAMQPQHLRAIAAQLYLELLQVGYTRVAEFQYLHHQPNGRPYDNPAEMSLQTLDAARKVGIGITNLPVHYQFAGFGAQPVGDQQRRFYNTPDRFMALVASLNKALGDDANSNLGIAGHSLRAIDKQTFTEVLAGTADLAGPIHMHIAEQPKEVEDCMRWSGARPVEYCLDNFAVDSRWCLIHATHMSDAETIRLAESGAVAGICPSTEANLGDGLFNAKPYLEAGGKFGIGSDSHISTSPVEELRWFEYGQRLQHNSRNALAGGPDRSTGRSLFEAAAVGGAQACAHNAGAIAVGKRADFVVLDEQSMVLTGRQGDELLDSWIFSGSINSVQDVYVGGRKVIEDGRHADQEQIENQFRATLLELRASA